ncbi:dTMP kinase [Gammaproteobacteria bacterium]|jgi:dTMP kinase|nr:dTMP kinase [Gammaproteobacteria bacterium]
MKIISFEGIEGVGKSTQIKLLNDYLINKGFKTEILREPGSTSTGEKIRDILLNSRDDLSSKTELLLMFSARAQLIKEKIENSTKDFILFDRFYDASSAYQGHGRGLSLKIINNLIEFIECPVPNITFLLDIDVSEGFARKVDDKKDRIESSGNTFFENVRKGYLELSKNNERIKLLDAKKQIGDLHQEIVSLVEKYL